MNDNTDNVTPFPTPINRDKIMLVCDCGCETFNLIANGTMECAYCGTVVSDTTGSAWRERMPQPTHKAAVEAAEEFNVRNSVMNNPEFARRKVVREIDHWNVTNTMAVVVGYNTEGRGHAWFNIETEDQRQWVMDRVMDLHNHLTHLDTSAFKSVTYVPDEALNEQVQEEVQEVSGSGGEEAGQPEATDSGAGDIGDAPSS